jgi:hypothetical protein
MPGESDRRNSEEKTREENQLNKNEATGKKEYSDGDDRRHYF